MINKSFYCLNTHFRDLFRKDIFRISIIVSINCSWSFENISNFSFKKVQRNLRCCVFDNLYKKEFDYVFNVETYIFAITFENWIDEIDIVYAYAIKKL